MSRISIVRVFLLASVFVSVSACGGFDFPTGTPIGDVELYYSTFNSVRAITSEGDEHTIAAGFFIEDIFTLRKSGANLFTGTKPSGRILRIEPSGFIETLADQFIVGPRAGSSGVFLNAPTDLTFFSADTLLVVANLDNSIIEMDVDTGEASVYFDAPITISDMFGILYDSSKSPYIYVTAPKFGEIHMIDPGTRESSVFAQNVGTPCYMAYNSDGDMLVTDPELDVVYRIPTDCPFPCDPPAIPFVFSDHELLRDPQNDPVRGPYGIGLNSSGDVFVAINASTGVPGRIVKISGNGFDVSVVRENVLGARGIVIP